MVVSTTTEVSATNTQPTGSDSVSLKKVAQPAPAAIQPKTVAPVATKTETPPTAPTTQAATPPQQSGRASVLAILKGDASTKWGSDYKMVKYEYDNQVAAYDWVLSQTKYPDIMAKAEQKWGNDYSMVKYEYGNQVTAYEWISAQMAYPDIMAAAKQKWGTDYKMVKYEYENQVSAYKSL